MLAAWRQSQLQVEWLTSFRGKGKSFAGPTVSRVKVTDISIQFCQVVHWSTKRTQKLEGDPRRYGALDHSSKRDSPCHTLLSCRKADLQCMCLVIAGSFHSNRRSGTLLIYYRHIHRRSAFLREVASCDLGVTRVTFWWVIAIGYTIQPKKGLCWRGTTWRLSTTLIDLIFDLWTTNGENAKLKSTRCLIQIRLV